MQTGRPSIDKGEEESHTRKESIHCKRRMLYTCRTRVFCDFYFNEAWTLVESFWFDYDAHFNVPFNKDKTITPNDDYFSRLRLSLSWMKSIRSQSTKWRVTCNYSPSSPLDRVDLVETT